MGNKTDCWLLLSRVAFTGDDRANPLCSTSDSRPAALILLTAAAEVRTGDLKAATAGTGPSLNRSFPCSLDLRTFLAAVGLVSAVVGSNFAGCSSFCPFPLAFDSNARAICNLCSTKYPFGSRCCAGDLASIFSSVFVMPIEGFGDERPTWRILPLCSKEDVVLGSSGALGRLLASLSACSMRIFRHGSFLAFRRAEAVYVRMRPCGGLRDVESLVVNGPFEDLDEVVDEFADGSFVTRIFLDFGSSFGSPVDFRLDGCFLSIMWSSWLYGSSCLGTLDGLGKLDLDIDVDIVFTLMRLGFATSTLSSARPLFLLGPHRLMLSITVSIWTFCTARSITFCGA